jgi:hypothetical protein
MKKKMVYGLTAVAMLMVAPTASAGYWTGHAEAIKDFIENWILNHTLTGQQGPVERVNPATHAPGATSTARTAPPAAGRR